MKALAAALLALALALAVFRFLDADEVEHLHSTWHVLRGALPYVDFFEHHHPLLWYALAPVLALAGESASAVIVFRIVFFLLTLAVARATYRLAIECRASREAAWLAVCLLLSMTTFVSVAIEIRPDVPQLLFGVVSVTYFARMRRTRAAADAVRSGVFAALGFLFLQKAALLLVLYPAAFLALAARRQVPWRLGLYLAGAFVAACAPFALWLAATGSLDDYLVTNWYLNAHVGAGPASVSFLSAIAVRDFARNAVFWALTAALAWALARRRLDADYALPAGFGLGLLAVIFALNRVVDRYLAAVIPFLAVAIAMWLVDEFARRRVAGLRLAMALLLVMFVPGVALVRSLFNSNRVQLSQIQFVLDHSRPADPMYDERRDFNVFRPDAHYFWFMTRPGVRLYNGLTGGRFAGYDTCLLLNVVRPRFVSLREGDFERCGLAGLYRPTPFAKMFERGGE
jgi:4-amino-4-deoxy-L-arabinose transferase-like glycosyltransferase